MPRPTMAQRGFTLIELLIVVALIGLLAALLVAALGHAKEKARNITCAGNLRQINLGLQMYSDDSRDTAPAVSGSMNPTFSLVAYKRLMKNYIGPDGPGSGREKVFACPSDRFYY